MKLGRFQIKIAVMLWAWDFWHFWHSHPAPGAANFNQTESWDETGWGTEKLQQRWILKNWIPQGFALLEVHLEVLEVEFPNQVSRERQQILFLQLFYTCLQNSTEWVFRRVRKKIMFSGFWSTFLAWVGLNTILTPVGRSLHILWKREVITLLPNQNFMWDCHTHVFF